MRVVLPSSISDFNDAYDASGLADSVFHALCEEARCATPCGQLLDRPMGFESGFFSLPAAQLAEWGVPEHTIRRVMEFALLGHFAYRVDDDYIDAGRGNAMLVAKAGLARAMMQKRLLELVERSDLEAILEASTDASIRYARSVRLELAHRADPHLAFRPEELEALGDRAAPGVVLIYIMCSVASRMTIAPALAEAILGLCGALQLIDDLQDLAVDLRDGNPTWPASTLTRAYQDARGWDSSQQYGALERLGFTAIALRLAHDQAAAACEDLAELGADTTLAWARAWSGQVTGLQSA